MIVSKVKLVGGPSNGVTIQFGSPTDIKERLYLNGSLYYFTGEVESGYYLMSHGTVVALGNNE